MGLMVVDAVGRTIDRFPERGSLVLFDRVELTSGGCAINSAAALAALGVDVGVLARVGDDALADFLMGRLRQLNVDGSQVVRDGEAGTSFTFVAVDESGERSFFHTIGANGRLCAEDVNYDEVGKAKIFHVAGSYLMPAFDGEPTAAVLRRARAGGAMTTLDTAYNDRVDDWLALIEPCLPHLSCFMPSLKEARAICGRREVAEMARFFREKGAERVVIKLGAEGSYYYDGRTEVTVPCFEVDVVDTTGAGDAFVGGFLYGMLRGLPPGQCLTWGNAVAAQCVSAVGASSGLKSLAEMEAWLRTARRKGS